MDPALDVALDVALTCWKCEKGKNPWLWLWQEPGDQKRWGGKNWKRKKDRWKSKTQKVTMSLQQEMKTLSDQMGHARVISKDDINTDEVGIGCVIECLGDKGHKVIYKILGPWEADPDQQILSYQSKLAQNMGGIDLAIA